MTPGDELAIENHLDLAVRHLETARQLMDTPNGSAAVCDRRRGRLRVASVDAGVVLDHLIRLIAGDDLESELARLLAELDEHADE